MSDNPYESPQTQPLEATYPELTSETKNWAMLCHLSALSFLVSGIGHIIGPLLIWLIKRTDHPFIDDQGKESINFQISILIYSLLISPTVCIGIGVVLLIAIWIANIVFVVLASIKASSGEAYRYPLTIRLVK